MQLAYGVTFLRGSPLARGVCMQKTSPLTRCKQPP